METPKIFKNKKVVYALIMAAVAFAVWYVWAGKKRAAQRNAWVNYIATQPDTNTWKASIMAKATTAGRTFAEQVTLESLYLYPKNLFIAPRKS